MVLSTSVSPCLRNLPIILLWERGLSQKSQISWKSCSRREGKGFRGTTIRFDCLVEKSGLGVEPRRLQSPI